MVRRSLKGVYVFPTALSGTNSTARSRPYSALPASPARDEKGNRARHACTSPYTQISITLNMSSSAA